VRLVNTIIDVAHDLNMDVMAEGVETEEQLGILQQYNCDYLQGYLFNKPLPAEDLLLLTQ
jgi:EAL domain-containing protein (putative c-di-GMP-specific phosphodiesterase class I)